MAKVRILNSCAGLDFSYIAGQVIEENEWTQGLINARIAEWVEKPVETPVVPIVPVEPVTPAAEPEKPVEAPVIPAETAIEEKPVETPVVPIVPVEPVTPAKKSASAKK